MILLYLFSFPTFAFLTFSFGAILGAGSKWYFSFLKDKINKLNQI